MRVCLAWLGCDDNVIDPPPPEALTVTFTLHDTLDRVIDTLAQRRVPMAATHRLQRALRAPVSLADYAGAISASQSGGRGGAVVFVILVDSAAGYRAYDAVLVPGGASERRAAGWDAAGLDFAGTLIAFFVEGIGSVPETPVDLDLWAETAHVGFVLAPAEHVLRGDPALHLRTGDLSLPRAPRPRESLCAGFAQVGDPVHLLPMPVYALRRGEVWSGGVANGGQRHCAELRPEDESGEELEFYLLFL